MSMSEVGQAADVVDVLSHRNDRLGGTERLHLSWLMVD